MKRYFINLIFIFVLCASTLAQTDTTLVGNWNIDFQGTLELLTPYERSRLDSLGQQAIDVMEQNFSAQSFLFASDGAFIGSSAQGSMEGTWGTDGNALQITSSTGSSISHEIISINSEEMVLRVTPQNDPSAYIHKILLNKTQ